MRKFLIVLTLFIAVGAVGGAVMMWAKMPWQEVFFKDFTPSGFVLLAVNGLPRFAAALMLIKKHRLAYPAVLCCGIILMSWIGLEWWVWGFNPVSNIYFMFGFVEAAAAIFMVANNR